MRLRVGAGATDEERGLEAGQRVAGLPREPEHLRGDVRVVQGRAAAARADAGEGRRRTLRHQHPATLRAARPLGAMLRKEARRAHVLLGGRRPVGAHAEAGTLAGAARAPGVLVGAVVMPARAVVVGEGHPARLAAAQAGEHRFGVGRELGLEVTPLLGLDAGVARVRLTVGARLGGRGDQDRDERGEGKSSDTSTFYEGCVATRATPNRLPTEEPLYSYRARA